MTAYPEHEKLTAVADQTQAIGEFLDWLQGQGVQLMRYREDLEDIRPTDIRCFARPRPDGPGSAIPCKPTSQNEGDVQAGANYWSTHCLHWHDPDREREPGRPVAGYVLGIGLVEDWRGVCCWCGKGREYTITTRGWVHEQRGFEQLLADWAGIDLKKVEAEKRQMLAAIATANAPKKA